jgi:hypothetical protein
VLKKLINKLKNMNRDANSFDPSKFYDPIAMQTDWTPVKAGGSSFQSHKLVVTDSNRVEFRATIGAKAFYLIFLFAGIVVFLGFVAARLSAGNFAFDIGTIIPLLVGLVFAFIGGSMLYFGTAPVVFDKPKGYFWKGRKSPDEVIDISSIKNFTELSKIHALQLISEYCRTNKNSFYSYELNLVLENADRINVVDHGNKNNLMEDAQSLSRFLGKLLWDAT